MSHRKVTTTCIKSYVEVDEYQDVNIFRFWLSNGFVHCKVFNDFCRLESPGNGSFLMNTSEEIHIGWRYDDNFDFEMGLNVITVYRPFFDLNLLKELIKSSEKYLTQYLEILKMEKSLDK